MSLLKAFESGAGSVVIIDDLYINPNPTSVSGDSLSQLFDELESSLQKRTELATLLKASRDSTAAELIDKVNDCLEELYTLHLTTTNPLLQTLFGDIDEEKTIALGKLKLLEQAIEKFFNVKPKTFGKLEDSRGELKNCSIAFIDFFLEGVTNHEEARRHHKAVKDELAEKISIDDGSYPKVIVLMSTSLPAPSELALFRMDTGVRGAFFHTIDKANFSATEIESCFKQVSDSYASAFQLNNYLETIEREISTIAANLSSELRSRLDVHDLTILKTLRLDGESDTPQSYLTFVLSEALAARVRMAEGLQVQVLPNEHIYGDAPFDGKLLPSSVLFELFSDIAVSPTPITTHTKISFGDVLECVDGKDNKKLYLVISPACDLQRCDSNYEVLSVPGEILESQANLASLIHGYYSFGQGSLVLRLHTEDEVTYNKIKFNYKSMKTFPVTEFCDSRKYRRIARLTDIFAQEIKTLALNNVARVGVPIDPSFSIAVKVKIQYQFNGDGAGAPKISGGFDSDGSEYLPAVIAMGRQYGASALSPTVMFSKQFKERLQKMLDEKLKVQTSSKLKAVKDHFDTPSAYQVALSNSSSTWSKNCTSDVSITYSSKLSMPNNKTGFQIYLYNEIEES